MIRLKQLSIFRSSFHPDRTVTKLAPKRAATLAVHCVALGTLLTIAGCLWFGQPSRIVEAASAPAVGQMAGKPANAAARNTGNHLEQTEQQDDKAVFRHSPVVRSVGRLLHLKADTAARLFEFFNFGLLVAGALFFFLKFFPRYLRHHREEIRKHLLDARAARERAEARLQEIEEKLSGLDREIQDLRERANRELAAEEGRMREAMESERQRILATADREIAAATGAARREIQRFAGELAIDRARRKIALSDRDDRTLTARIALQMAQEFAAGPPAPNGNHGRNGGHS